ncbi:acyl-CoA dehydrogenase [Singulisphaera sp. PoT]|uniref:acyl-CoA dehydrogenase n=1 Tax=Singulisphaera sp. PoT TaxID=3411797 RepID=UPI003BF55E9F
MSHQSSTSFAWPITQHDNELETLVARLAEADGAADVSGAWSPELWSILVNAGAAGWGLPKEWGGPGYDRSTLLERYARVAVGSMTAAFVLSQHDAGVRRLLAASERPAAAHWLDEISQGRAFTTVGISQLTTSRRLGPRAMTATEVGPGQYRLNGSMPWVTGAEHANMIVTGAVLEDDRQLLLAIPTDRAGFSVRPPFALAALQASSTSEVVCEDVPAGEEDVLVGPMEDVMKTASAAGTGGLETSALALGQARAALDALHAEAPRREDLVEPFEALAESWAKLWHSLCETAEGVPEALTSGQVRGQANDFVLRATQAYLTARKGSGFLRDDPAQRWARQALFFLVWSCPSPVAQAAIRDLAGICST